MLQVSCLFMVSLVTLLQRSYLQMVTWAGVQVTLSLQRDGTASGHRQVLMTSVYQAFCQVLCAHDPSDSL